MLSLLNKCGMADYNPVQTPGIGNELKVEPEGSVLLRKGDIVQHQNMVRFLIFFLPVYAC